VEGARLEHDADLVGRFVEVDERAAADRGAAARRGDQAEQHPHRRRLARPVGTQEPDHPPRLDFEAEVVDGTNPAEVLGQAVRGDLKLADDL
jgi:hypothetical protein